ncbi:MAG TPA: endonuclease MutS2 [Gemmatimonadaceae bacterium]|nr:endonuclease MutS2 [Gemmatimonadaceae bacterium]
MNPHALGVLEFSRVVELAAAFATSDAGGEHVRALLPHHDRERLEREHARVAAVSAVCDSEGGWNPAPAPRVDLALQRTRVAEARWTPAEAAAVGVVLTSAASTRRSLEDPRRPAAALAVLAPIVESVVAIPELARAITRAIDDDGAVRDDASPTLKRLRRELRSAEQDIVRILERAIAKLEPHQQVPDASVTVRNGRYVIPVRRDGRATLGGIVHDTSASGGTLFVEPPAAIEASNRMRELEVDATREVDRILLELTDAARPHADSLQSTYDALIELDSLYARARFAKEYRCAPVSFASAGEPLIVNDGRHPLLTARGVPVVAFDLAMTHAERTLLVSGPNTGGKTVLLKALGLFQAMAQSGVPVPAGVGTTLPIVDDIFADVGDEQSIEASLSTFSAHVTNLREVLGSATSDSLVLIDELGSGTDPAEGAALGAAVLESLTSRGARTIATTHLGALKDLPLTVNGVVNASLQFDEQQLAPTYRLLKGIPGRSYGLQIARRLDLPVDVLDRAIARVPEQERAVSALLAELERREAELSARDATLRADESRTREHGQRIAERERSVRERERAVERAARADARRYLLDARAEVERTIAALKAAPDGDRTDQVRAARQALERRIDEHGAMQAALDDDHAPESAIGASAAVDVGGLVEVDTLGGKIGRVMEFRENDAVVAVGGMKVTVPRASLRATGRAEGVSGVRTAVGDMPELDAKSEIDLRGVRVADVDEMLLASLDAAVRADLKSLRIIHGKGTGALRERVAEMLKKDVRVHAFRLGAWNEGGAGVTVAEFA